jgi:hypothetical protein
VANQNSPKISDDEKKMAVRLLVTAIRNPEFHQKLDEIFKKPYVSDLDPKSRIDELQRELQAVFRQYQFTDVSFDALLAVSLDYCDRDTAGYDKWRRDRPSYHPDWTLGRAWLEESRIVSVQAGGVVG